MKGASDSANRAQDVPFRAAGIGMAPRFRCGRCDKPSAMHGSGTRAVSGLRTKVCAKCRVEIDAA